VTNPNDPYIVPVYSAQYSDSQCSNKITDYAETSVEVNGCLDGGGGVYVFIDYVANDITQSPLNIAPPSRIENPIIVYEESSSSACTEQDLSQTVQYEAWPYSGCALEPGETIEYVQFTCSTSQSGNTVTLNVNTYSDSQCSMSIQPQVYTIEPCSYYYSTLWIDCPGGITPASDDSYYYYSNDDNGRATPSPTMMPKPPTAAPTQSPAPTQPAPKSSCSLLDMLNRCCWIDGEMSNTCAH